MKVYNGSLPTSKPHRRLSRSRTTDRLGGWLANAKACSRTPRKQLDSTRLSLCLFLSFYDPHPLYPTISRRYLPTYVPHIDNQPPLPYPRKRPSKQARSSLVFLIYEIPWHDLSSSYLSNHLHCCTAYATCARTVAYNDTTHLPPTRLLVSGMERMDILYVPAYNMMERLVTYLHTYLLTT